MATCSCSRSVRREIDPRAEPWKTTYDHSYFYENAIDHTFVHLRDRRKIRDDLKVQDPIALRTPKSVYKNTFSTKYPEDHSTDYCRRSSWSARGSLKPLHEAFVADPPRPMKIGATTTGSTYVFPEKFQEPIKWGRTSPAEEFTFSIPSHCREGLSSFSPNESGYTKYLDPYATTSQSTHCAFNLDQQNGVARKNIMTFYDALGVPKNRGFGPKRLEPFGSCFHRDYVIPYRVHTKITPSVPFFGKTSCYDAAYDFVPTNLMNREEEITFPAVFKILENSSYCTEQCHTGTGWPVRAALDIGKTQGTF